MLAIYVKLTVFFFYKYIRDSHILKFPRKYLKIHFAWFFTQSYTKKIVYVDKIASLSMETDF